MDTFQPRILDQARSILRRKHYALRTEISYLSWIRRFILFHGRRYPGDLGAADVGAFLTHLAIKGKVAAATHAVPAQYLRSGQVCPSGKTRPWAPSSSSSAPSSISPSTR
jgi:hypothetical protein